MTRRHLATFIQAFIHQDAEWMVDSAVALGLLRARNDVALVRGVEEILADYAMLPLKEWSLGELFLRLSRLSPPGSVQIPHELLVFMRTLDELESALRRLDPEMNVIEMLRDSGKEVFEAIMWERSDAGLARLKHELAFAMIDFPEVLASQLNRMRTRGARPQIGVSISEVPAASATLERTVNRLSLAVVTLGLFVGSSLLMQHSIGPQLFKVPALALAGYALAIWYTIRIARAVSRPGRL